MAKLTRYLQKIFANNSNQVGVFGTGVDKETSKNVETLQSADYENGWSSAIITNKNYPIWQEMDGVQYGLSYQIKYLQQAGIPEWLSTETYYTNSYCRYGADLYYSLQDNNTNHNPALNNGWWTPACANTNLSNLTSTGKDKVVALANELDWANAVTVSTTNSSGYQSYTAASDGLFFASALSQGSSASRGIYCYLYPKDSNDTFQYGDSGGFIGTASQLLSRNSWVLLKGEKIEYTIYASGAGTLDTRAIFIPFKKA